MSDFKTVYTGLKEVSITIEKLKDELGFLQEAVRHLKVDVDLLNEQVTKDNINGVEYYGNFAEYLDDGSIESKL